MLAPQLTPCLGREKREQHHVTSDAADVGGQKARPLIMTASDHDSKGLARRRQQAAVRQRGRGALVLGARGQVPGASVARGWPERAPRSLMPWCSLAA